MADIDMRPQVLRGAAAMLEALKKVNKPMPAQQDRIDAADLVFNNAPDLRELVKYALDAVAEET